MASLQIVNETGAHVDARAVEAIREGDPERYRELVDRYADKVFAIAWCRLGDRSLAEEAAQEAFIAGFQRLALLNRAERFGAWISTIARHTAINLGLKHRSELNRREQWALEQAPEPTAPLPAPPDPGSAPTGETLRATLATLPPIHRESLVLFYLENRSIAEAADALGISEGTFKVRLHRARAALRDALAEQLESNLHQLRAPRHLSATVMLALPTATASPTLLAAGGFWAGLGKFLPFGASLVLLQILFLLPGLGLMYWMGRREIANLRDPKGLEGRTLQRQLNRSLLMTFLVLVIGTAGFWGFQALISATSYRVLLETPDFLRSVVVALGVFMMACGVVQARRLVLVRNRTAVALVAASFTSGGLAIGMGLWQWPVGALFIGQALFMVATTFARPSFLGLLHTSLLQRAAAGCLPPGTSDSPEPARDIPPSSRPSLAPLEFARFLSRQQQISEARRCGNGLVLTLNPVRPRWRDSFGFRSDPSLSTARLDPNGTVTVTVGPRDFLDLQDPLGPRTPGVDALQSSLATTLQQTWSALAIGGESAAAKHLAHPREQEIFRVSPDRSPSRILHLRITRVLAALVLAFGIYDIGFRPTPDLARALGLKPLAIGEPEVREFLASLAPGSSNHTAAVEEWNMACQISVRLPGPGLFTPPALAAVRSNALARVGYLLDTNTATVDAVRAVLLDGTFLNLALAGLVDDQDLARLRITPETLRTGLAALPESDRQQFFELKEMPFGVNGERFSCLWIGDLARRAQFLQRMNCLDPALLQQAAQALVTSQILPRNALTNRWGKEFHGTLAGLFATGRVRIFSETRDALTLLSAAGALNQIDREACIQALLRLHQGKGLFASRSRSKPTGPTLCGDSEDTYATFESLRLLGALDRVQDLRDWEFRPYFADPYPPRKPGFRALAHEHLEAFCVREAFRGTLREGNR
jgi:RNA polymerase sigma-70 factor (ECF subfamily)